MIQIIGAGGFAREVAAYLGGDCMMVDTTKQEPILKVATIIAIGDEEIRSDIVEKYPNLLYSSLQFGIDRYFGRAGSDTVVGVGSIICPQVFPTVNVKIGKHTIININTTIGHDTIIGDFATVNPGCNISGNVKIGNNCHIGTGVSIRNGVSICDDVIVGMGAAVVGDITEPGMYLGVPAKLKK